MSKKKVLITGGSGLLALNIALYKKKNWEIFLVTNTKSVSIDGVATIKLNLDSADDVEEMVASIKPEYIIHTAGLTNVDLCESNRSGARISNVIITRNIAKAAGKHNIRLIHISTDHFSRSSMENSSEDDIDIPLNYYAQTKLEAEFEVNKYAENSAILRTIFFGWGPKHRKSFSDCIIKSLRKGQQIHLFSDVFYSPILIDDLADIIDQLLNHSFKGVLNVVGDDRISKYEFGKKVAQAFHLNDAKIIEDKISERNLMVKRPMDMSLSNSKLKKLLGEKDYSVSQSLKKLNNQEFSGRKDEIDASVLKDVQKVINYGKQTIDDDDFDALMTGLNRSLLTQGPKVKEFEEKIAKYVGAKYAVSVSNLTNGLHIACLAAGLGNGDSLITSPISFLASSNCAIYCGATPHFADIDMNTLNIDPKQIRKKCEELQNVKVIVPVHFAGSPCDMIEIKKVADDFNAVVIEDAAHALGASYSNGNKVGCCEHSLMTGFSFHPVKSITMGEGGVITTNDEEVYKQLCRLRSHGIIKGNDPLQNDNEARTNGALNPWYYEMQQLGFNYRVTDLQCCLGVSQLKKLDGFVEKRVAIAKSYDRAFCKLKNLEVTQIDNRDISGHHLYNILVDFNKIGMSKNDLFKIVREKGIGLHVHYIPIVMQPYYKKMYGTEEENYPNSLQYYRKVITLPVYPDMTDDCVAHVIDTISTLIG